MEEVALKHCKRIYSQLLHISESGDDYFSTLEKLLQTYSEISPAYFAAIFIRASTMYPVPAFILSGYTFPAESMGAGMNFAAKFFPMSYMSNNLREMFLTGAASKLFVDVRSLILIGAACLVLTALIDGKNFPRI